MGLVEENNCEMITLSPSRFSRKITGENIMRNRLIYLFTLALLTIGITSTSVTAQNRPYRVSDRQMITLMSRIETKTDAYKREMDLALNRGRLSGSDTRETVQDYIADFENSTDQLKSNFDSRRSVSSDVSEVLNRAAFIDRFMTRNRLTTSAQTQWTGLKTDLNTLASNYNVSWNWNQNQNVPTYPGNNTGNNYPVYTGSDAQLRTLFTRIETRTDTYKNTMSTALNSSRLNGSDSEDTLNEYVADFENATDRLKQNFDSRRSTSADATEVLNRAIFIDRFMTRNRLTVTAQTQWRTLKTDLNTLSTYYRLSWNWNQALPTYPGNTGNNNQGGNFPGGRGFDARLTGTYRLNTSQSDNVTDVINRSTGVYETNQRDNVKRNLERRLTSPERIAIQKTGTSVTLASSLSPQVTFDANGVAQTETTARGRTITVTASSNNTSLMLNYEGDRMNDFNVVFEPTRNGQLRVTRKIYLENRSEQVSVSSVYDKVNNAAEWTVNDGSTTGGNYPSTGGNNSTYTEFYVPNGTRLQASLQNVINTRDSQVGDKFTMEVSSPSQYQGAIIEGRIGTADTSGRVSGRANVSLEFDTIRLRNGRTYRFAGIIDSVRAANGDNVTVNNEGTVRDSNQTTKTATRAGIGAALGALIGAIAGGGSGAAVGAVVGAGAGAGTVLVQGRDNIDLGMGSEFSITSSAPSSLGSNRQ